MTQISSRNLPWSLIPSSRSVANIYLPPSNFMTMIRITTTHLQRIDSSSYLEADQTLSTISANSRIKWTESTTTIICPHPSFLISSEHFLVSTASRSPLHTWSGIDWTLPWHQRSFTSCNFLPLITSTSHVSNISHCLVSLHLSTCVGSIYAIWNLSTVLKWMVPLKLLSSRR